MNHLASANALKGISTTSASRANPFVPGRRKASHKFLRLRQPIDHPQETRLLPGQLYSFPFSFVVPESISPQQCEHSTKNVEVEQAHNELPPTFESRTSRFWEYAAGTRATKACKISYKIRVVISAKPQATGIPKHRLCDVSRPLRIIPSAKIIKRNDDVPQCLVHERQLECRFMGRKLGTFHIAAEEPKSIQVSPTCSGLKEASTSAVQLHLTFDSTTNSPPPWLCKVYSKLEIATYYGTSPWESFPTMKDMKRTDTDQEAYITTTPLRPIDLTSVRWEKLPSFESAIDKMEVSALESSVGSSLEIPKHSYTTSITIPIDMTEVDVLVPTFHSCLVSRTYTIDLTLSYNIPSAICKSTMNLRIPIEVVFRGREA